MSSNSVLFLTDHKTHSVQNSLYKLVVGACKHPGFGEVLVASRSEADNDGFFKHFTSTEVHCVIADESFSYDEGDFYHNRQTKVVDIKDLDYIWLRLPRPIPEGFFPYITEHFSADRMINNPNGIAITGSKEFLVNFRPYCPPIEVVNNKKELLAFARKYHTVVKPLEDYGGRGIFRIDGDTIVQGHKASSISILDDVLPPRNYPVLAMRFLKNVVNGDKRIVVCGGKVITSSLRLPAQDSWLCNISQGGSSHASDITEREKEIVSAVTNKLTDYGVYLFGIDTLEDDDGIRVLSEINTLSVGGITPSEQNTGASLSYQVVDTIYNILTKKH